jgi:rare lipoprotein A
MDARGRSLGGVALAAAMITTPPADAASGQVAGRPVAPGTAGPGTAVSTPRPVTIAARFRGRSPRHVLHGARVRVGGTLGPGLAARTVRLEVRRAGHWATVDRARTGGGGRFRANWRPRRTGRFRMRARFAGDGLNARAERRIRGRLYVYRTSQASWYGPGLYGGGLACGGRLHPGTLGVAHKTLPCGTRVTFRYRGRSMTVPVIDRGPYVAGRDWDLTGAAKGRLRFPSTGTVWSTR